MMMTTMMILPLMILILNTGRPARPAIFCCRGLSEEPILFQPGFH